MLIDNLTVSLEPLRGSRFVDEFGFVYELQQGGALIPAFPFVIPIGET